MWDRQSSHSAAMVALHLAFLSLTISHVIGGIDNISNIINSLSKLISFSKKKLWYEKLLFFFIVGPSAKQWNAKILSGLKKKIDRVKSKLEISPKLKGNKKETVSDEGEGKNEFTDDSTKTGKLKCLAH